MKRLGTVGLIIALGVGSSFADGDPVKDRQDLMKANGAATKSVVGMMKGAPFDLDVVKAALKTYANAAARAPALFPENSKTGGDTEALPAIWDNKSDFTARFAKFADDVNAASVSITDQASFQAAMPGVLKNCGSCHETYRAKKN
jgi:cytochrome c556